MAQIIVCAGHVKSGEPCGQRPTEGSSFCWLHDPDRVTVKRKRRASTFGNVRKLKSGRWQATYWHIGRQHVGPQTFSAKADANAYLAKIQTSVNEGAWISPNAGKLTVGELGKQWLRADPGKRESTRIRDEAILRIHIEPVIGKARIESITKTRIQALVNEWSANKAPRTVQRQYDVLRAMFNHAVENDWLVRSPCRGIKEPEPSYESRQQLAAEDVWALADAMSNEYRAMVYLGAVLGLRWGEVAGLTVSSLDLERSLVKVTQQLGRDHNLASPKSRAGTRTLGMPTALTDLLQKHIEKYGFTKPDELIFQSPDGGALDYTNWRRRSWLPAVAKAGLNKVGFHDLRRANATALVRSGVDVKTAQARLGHSDPRLTLAVYAQATSEGDHDAAQRMGDRFLGDRSLSPSKTNESLTHAERTSEDQKTKPRHLVAL